MSNEHPILMSEVMIRAYLANLKNQTRRTRNLDVINKNPYSWKFVKYVEESIVKNHCGTFLFESDFGEFAHVKPPYGMPGDYLWFRETHKVGKSGMDGKHYIYKTDSDSEEEPGKWKPSIHMPREAARFTPPVLDVRVEKLLSISVQDSIDEGIEILKYPGNSPQDIYFDLWDSLNGMKSHMRNPWVWVYKFPKYSEMRG